MSGSILRPVVLATAIALVATAATAQPSWNIEVLSGLDITQLTGDDTKVSALADIADLGSATVSGDIGSTKVGFVAGALATVFFTDNVGLQTGLVWARKGSDGQIAVDGDVPPFGLVSLDVDLTLTLDYLEIPVLAVVQLPAGEALSMRFVAGPTIAFNTNADFEMSLFDVSQSFDVGDEIKGVDVGGLVGAGLVIPVAAANVVLDARYSFGFTSVDDFAPIDGREVNVDWKNSAITMVAGVEVPLGL
jgi:hypothetical protein